MRPRELAGALLGYVLLAILFTWPLARQMFSAVPYYNDTWIFAWDIDAVRTALLDPAREVFFTTDIFHPDGISLAFHTLAPLYGALAIPIQPVLGLVATYNLFVLSAFVFSGLAAYFLIHRLTDEPAAAFIGGALFTLSPYHQVHAAHLNLLTMQFLPLTVWAIIRFLETASWRHALIVATTAALSFYACHEYALMSALFAGTALVYAVVTRGRGPLRLARAEDLAGRGVACVAIALGLAAPGLLPMIAEAAIETHYAEAVDIQFSADLFSWFTPSVLHSVWGGYTMKIYQHFPGVLAEWTTYLGVVVALLVLYAIVRRVPGRGIWITTTVVFGLLAMGPRLRILGEATAIPLPYALLKSLPFLSAMREPARFAAMVTLATAVLAAFGVRALRRSGWQRLAWLALPLALVDFVQAPIPTTSAAVPGFLSVIADDPEPYAVLDVPLGLEFREHLYHQAIHRKRTFLGYVARIPQASRRFIETLPLLDDPADWPASNPQFNRAMIDLAEAHQVRYALVHRSFYLRRHQPGAFDTAIERLLDLPGAREVAREHGFVAIRLDGK